MDSVTLLLAFLSFHSLASSLIFSSYFSFKTMLVFAPSLFPSILFAHLFARSFIHSITPSLAHPFIRHLSCLLANSYVLSLSLAFDKLDLLNLLMYRRRHPSPCHHSLVGSHELLTCTAFCFTALCGEHSLSYSLNSGLKLYESDAFFS